MKAITRSENQSVSIGDDILVKIINVSDEGVVELEIESPEHLGLILNPPQESSD